MTHDPGRWSATPTTTTSWPSRFAAVAEILASGDRDLLHLIDPPLPALTPRAFLDRLEGLSGRPADSI
jgi:hypothetical protein